MIHLLSRLFLQEDINFLFTNRIPRRYATLFMGWFGKLSHPLIRIPSMALWRWFAGVDLGDAAKTRFTSLHDCFIRQLKPGARAIDPDPAIVVSPCDAIVGAAGTVNGVDLIQAKGSPYTLTDLLVDPELVRTYRDGCYVTLRLTAGMYHRFHAPADCTVERVTYMSGDTWNTNPIALARVEKLFCKNEHAVIQARLRAPASSGGHKAYSITLVPVASILVASIRLHFLDVLLHLRHRGAHVMPCDVTVTKGQEMGWFELGSTIIVFAPRGFTLHDGVRSGAAIRMGQPLLRLPG